MSLKIAKDLVFNSRGLIPAIAQDYSTGEIRMLAYMNEEALEKTVQTGFAHYYSRSRQELWKKGETSGHLQEVCSIRTDCDMDTVLLLVEQTGPACHTDRRNCFYREYSPAEDEWEEVDPLPDGSLGAILGHLQEVIDRRDRERPEDSYTTTLLEGTAQKSAQDTILEKVGEETVETILAAKNENKEELAREIADFLYHLLVLCRQQGIRLDELADVLFERRS
ncbi:MAG: bifunctional phosphoribosyl-AMP cyclohydrolase/phosphoribosyl-ATP diphosphatase HisIE [bacterium]